MNLHTIDVNLTLSDSTINSQDVIDKICDIHGVDVVVSEPVKIIPVIETKEDIKLITLAMAQDICGNLNLFDDKSNSIVISAINEHLEKNLL